ncbi:MAG: TonB-dependent receptor, partial [Flavobacteriales bacterium]|nr:TonB-dependent receptor [Flavobacteriales bacterium]
LGKVRLNYAQVGNDAPWGSIQDTYSINSPFNGNPIVGVGSAKRNPNLKPELSSSIEAGLEMNFFNNRLGFDLAYYKTNTVDQIVPLSVSYATGFRSKYVNIGEVQNSGIELMLFGTAIQTDDFSWDIVLNYSRNRNEVISLGDDIDNLQLAALQGGITINAREGEAYGAIQGTDYVYDTKDGKFAEGANKIVGADGYYKRSGSSDNVIGNVQPDFNAGITNSFRYKNFTASFLVDMQWGGQIFSLDQWYGRATGLYSSTDFENDLGNPVRNHLSDGGGLVLDGVMDNGSGGFVENTTRVRADNFRVFGYSRNPNKGFIYDASYVKLREMSIGYTLPSSMLDKVALKGATFSIVGSNLFIFYKDLPDADP